MDGFYYTFGGAATGNSFAGFSNVFQQQVDPTILKIMNIANSDPVINAFCRANGITSAQQIHQMLVAEWKKRYEASLKTYAKDYLEGLVPELERGYDPNNVKHKHGADVEGFKSYYVQLDDEHTIYQCSCGMLVIDEDPKNFMSDHDAADGHNGYGSCNKKYAKDLPPLEHKTTLNIKTELVELDSDDGINYTLPNPEPLAER